MTKTRFNKMHYNSPLILTFALVSFVVLILDAFTAGASTFRFFTLLPTSLFDPMLYVRMLTCTLGHANWEHFVGNFTIILLVGPAMEERYGYKSLLKMMIITAFITGFIHFALNMQVLGSSGIAFMLIILSSITNIKKGYIPLTLVLILFIFIGREVQFMFSTDTNISHIGHIAGGICGAVLGYKVSSEKITVEGF